MVIRLVIDEGTQYKVGAVKITGTTVQHSDIIGGCARCTRPSTRNPGWDRTVCRWTWAILYPQGLVNDIEAVEDFYGARGYIEVNESSRI